MAAAIEMQQRGRAAAVFELVLKCTRTDGWLHPGNPERFPTNLMKKEINRGDDRFDCLIEGKEGRRVTDFSD